MRNVNLTGNYKGINLHRRAVAICLYVSILILFARPLLGDVKLEVPYIEQPDNKTCLPTSLAMVLHYKGKIELNNDIIFKLHKRTKYDRYNVPDIVKEYNLYALPCWYELGWNEDTLKRELDAGNPVITGCDLGRYGHFVLIIGYTNDGKWILHDPTGKSPRYPLGGKAAEVDWNVLNWRGGVFIHSKPFPEPQISGKLMKITGPDILAPGEIGEVRFEIMNNGKKQWPEELYLVPVKPLFSSSAMPNPESVFYNDSWLTPSRVMRINKVPPGQTARFAFKIKSPRKSKPASFREYWNILDSKGQRLSQESVSGPGLLDMNVKVLVEPHETWQFPIMEKMQDNKPSLDWHVKFGSLKKSDVSNNNKNALSLYTPGKKYDAAWIGNSTWSDYKVEAMIYCEYRPDEKPMGWERIGLFARDNGDHAIIVKNYQESGDLYCMTYDSDDGRLRAGNILNGLIADFHPKPYVYIKKSGWHKFSILCSGNSITYELDDKPFYQAQSKIRMNGSCGVFYSSTFDKMDLIHGISFYGFSVRDD